MIVSNQLAIILVQKTYYFIEYEKVSMLNIILRDVSLFVFSLIDYIYNKGYENGKIFADSLAKRIYRRISQEAVELKL